MSEKIVRLDRGYMKEPLDPGFDATKDLIETVDSELATLGFEALPNAQYELIPYMSSRSKLRLAAVRVVEVETGRLEQKAVFGCAMDDETGEFYLINKLGDNSYRMYPVEPNAYDTFTMFQSAAIDRAGYLN